MRIPTLACAAGTVLLVGCGGGPERASPSPATPALHELARLDATGRLDRQRLTCAIVEAPSLARDFVEKLPELREVRRRESGRSVAAHARSVQGGMRAADIQTAAGQAALQQARVAQYHEEQRDYSSAAQSRDWVQSIRAYARDESLVPSAGYLGGDLPSMDQGELLVEYARLRASQAAGAASADVVDGIQRIQATEPEVVDLHASLLLGLLQDPELECAAGS